MALWSMASVNNHCKKIFRTLHTQTVTKTTKPVVIRPHFSVFIFFLDLLLLEKLVQTCLGIF